jgi:hypothetical protein
MNAAFTVVGPVSKTYHPNGKVATETRRERFESTGRLYEHTRFYSSSGVCFNFVNKPVA